MLLACILGLSTIAAVPADVEDTACGYRVEIYAQCHGDREEYDRRHETADALLRAWMQRGQMADDSAELAGWPPRPPTAPAGKPMLAKRFATDRASP